VHHNSSNNIKRSKYLDRKKEITIEKFFLKKIKMKKKIIKYKIGEIYLRVYFLIKEEKKVKY
jgi:hypothetical protein